MKMQRKHAESSNVVLPTPIFEYCKNVKTSVIFKRQTKVWRTPSQPAGSQGSLFHQPFKEALQPANLTGKIGKPTSPLT
jgi:hypothetical protein